MTRRAVLRQAVRASPLVVAARGLLDLDRTSRFTPIWPHETIDFHLRQLERGAFHCLVIDTFEGLNAGYQAGPPFTAWFLARNPEKRQLVIQHTSESAENFMRQLVSILSADWFRNAYPQLRYFQVEEHELRTAQDGGVLVTEPTNSLPSDSFDHISIVSDLPIVVFEGFDQQRARWFVDRVYPLLAQDPPGSVLLLQNAYSFASVDEIVTEAIGKERKILCIPPFPLGETRYQISNQDGGEWYVYKADDDLMSKVPNPLDGPTKWILLHAVFAHQGNLELT